MVARTTAGSRRVPWWRQPAGPIYLASLVLSVGKGAWFTCWVTFFVRFDGISAGQFGIGVTVACAVGLVLSTPLGYLADQVGGRETLIVLGVIQGMAISCFIFFDTFWVVVVLTCLVVGAERTVPGIRIALLVAFASSGEERISNISTSRILTQGGMAVGALAGTLVLWLDNRAGHLTLIALYATASIASSLLLFRLDVDAVTGGRRRTRRGMAVLTDRPFLGITFFNGVLALNWGMLESGVPLWIIGHTDAPAWAAGLLIGFNTIAVVACQPWTSSLATTVSSAGRLGLGSGVLLALACVVFAGTNQGSGTAVIAALFVAAAIHVVGEVFFVNSGYGLSVGLTPDGAHGEYQGFFATGQSSALTLAPGLMALLLGNLAVTGWLVLAAVFLVGGAGTLATSRVALRARQRSAPVRDLVLSR